MKADNRAHLAAAARQRAQATDQRARDTLRQLDRAGADITFTAIADAAHVSRSWLYRQPELRAEIERLRRPSTPAVPAAQRASDASLRQRVDTLLDANKQLRRENNELRDQIANLLGERRAATPQKRATKMIGPCQ